MKRFLSLIAISSAIFLGIVALDSSIANAVNCGNVFPASLNNYYSGCTIPSGWANSLEQKIGITGSSVTSSLDYQINHIFTGYGSETVAAPHLQLSASGTGLAYNSSTGVFSLTNPQTVNLTGSSTAYSFPYWLDANGDLSSSSPLSLSGAGVNVTGTENITATTTLPLGIWQANGNVGIGTTNPGAALDVNGEVRSVYSSGFTLYNGASKLGQLYYSGGVVLNASSTKLFLAQGGSPKLTVDTSGNVGIGTTTPSSTLDVNGTTTIRSGLLQSGGNASLATTTATDLTDSGLSSALALANSGGHLSNFGGSSCSAGSFASSISATGALTCIPYVSTSTSNTWGGTQTFANPIVTNGISNTGNITSTTEVITTSTISHLVLPNVTSSILATDANGNVIATTTSGGGGLPSGSIATGTVLSYSNGAWKAGIVRSQFATSTSITTTGNQTYASIPFPSPATTSTIYNFVMEFNVPACGGSSNGATTTLSLVGGGSTSTLYTAKGTNWLYAGGTQFFKGNIMMFASTSSEDLNMGIYGPGLNQAVITPTTTYPFYSHYTMDLSSNPQFVWSQLSTYDSGDIGCTVQVSSTISMQQ